MTREALLHERNIARTELAFLADDPHPSVEAKRARWRQKISDIEKLLTEAADD